MILCSLVLIAVLASVIFSSNPLPLIILKYTEIFLPGEALKILRMQMFFLIHFFHWKSFDKKRKQHTDKYFSTLKVAVSPIEPETWLNILII